MADKVPKPCRKDFCKALTTNKHGYCDEHSTSVWGPRDKKRGSSSERGYGAKWRRVRALLLARLPFCTFPGCQKFAEEVDHIDGDKTNLKAANLRPYCKKHHMKKTFMVDNPQTRMLSYKQWEERYPIDTKNE